MLTLLFINMVEKSQNNFRVDEDKFDFRKLAEKFEPLQKL
jgi:hypothetical protein